MAICLLKRFAADFEMNSGKRVHVPRAPESEHKVAVVGGRPAGLSCAYFLRRAGHRPVIFETQPLLGGMLRYGIPDGKRHTLREVGEKIGVTRERVRQIEAQALKRLRNPSILHQLRGYLG